MNNFHKTHAEFYQQSLFTPVNKSKQSRYTKASRNNRHYPVDSTAGDPKDKETDKETRESTMATPYHPGISLQPHSPMQYNSKSIFGVNFRSRSPTVFLDSNQLQPLIKFAPPQQELDQKFQQTLKQIKNDFSSIFKSGGLSASKTIGSTRAMLNSKTTFPKKRASMNPSSFNTINTTPHKETRAQHRGNAFSQALNVAQINAGSSDSFEVYQSQKEPCKLGGSNFQFTSKPGKIMDHVNAVIQGKDLPQMRKKSDSANRQFAQKRVSMPENYHRIRQNLQQFPTMVNKGSKNSSLPFQAVPASTLEAQIFPQGPMTTPMRRSNDTKRAPDSRDSLRNRSQVLKQKLSYLEKVHIQQEQEIMAIQKAGQLPDAQSQWTASSRQSQHRKTKRRKGNRTKSSRKLQLNFDQVDKIQRPMDGGQQSPVSLGSSIRSLNAPFHGHSKLPQIRENNKSKHIEVRFDPVYLNEQSNRSPKQRSSSQRRLIIRRASSKLGKLHQEQVRNEKHLEIKQKKSEAIQLNNSLHPKTYTMFRGAESQFKPSTLDQEQNIMLEHADQPKVGDKQARKKKIRQNAQKMATVSSPRQSSAIANQDGRRRNLITDQNPRNQAQLDQLVKSPIEEQYMDRKGVQTAQRYDGKLYSGRKDSMQTSESSEGLDFKQKYPDFKRGITPVKPGNLSDMDSLQRAEIVAKMEQQTHQQQIFKRQDFELINERQEKFQDLMELSITTQNNESAIIPAATIKSSTLSNFPFQREGEGVYLHAYKYPKQYRADQPKRKISYLPTFQSSFRSKTNLLANQALPKLKKDSSKINDKASEGIDSAYGDDLDPKTQPLTCLHQIQEIQEKTAIQKNQAVMMQFIDYITNEQYPQNILQVQCQLEDKVLKQGFESYEQFEDPTMKKFSKYVQQRRAFYKVMKDMKSPKALEGMNEDPYFNFIKDCDEGMVQVLSLLQKINEGSLNLIGYPLNDTYCKALRDAFASKNFLQNLEAIQLDGNGMTSDGICMIMEGLMGLQRLKKLIYKNNKLDSQAPMGPNGSLRMLLLRPEPNNLDELRITNCKLQSWVVEEILNTVMNPNCQLRKLGLVNVGMIKSSAELVVDVLQNQQNIIDLDISYNQLTPSTMWNLAEALSENRNLQYLNLSWNNLKEHQTLSSLTESREMDHIYEMEVAQNLCKFIKYNQNLLHLDLSNTGLTKRMLIEFGGALRKARSLICLHLSGNPGLCSDDNAEEETQEEQALNSFLVENNIVKKSFNQELKHNRVFQQGVNTVREHFQKELLAQEDLKEVELENREQVTMIKKREIVKRDSLLFLKNKIKDESVLKIIDLIAYNNYRSVQQKEQLQSIRKYINLKDYLFKRVVCVPNFEPIHIDVVQKDNIQKVKDGLNVANQLDNGLKTRDFMENKQNNQNGQLTAINGEGKYKLIFDRFLGHKHDIGLGSAQWRQLTRTQQKCWVCEGMVYSLIFWSQNIGVACEDQIEGLVDEMMIMELEGQQKRICKLIKDGSYQNREHRLAYQVDVGIPNSCPETPVIQGQFTNWHPYKMTPIEDYCELIDQQQPNFITVLKQEGKCRKTVYDEEDLNPQETEDFEIKRQEYKKNYYTKNFNLVIQRNLAIKKPNLVFKEHLEQYNKPPEQEPKTISIQGQNVAPGTTPQTAMARAINGPDPTPRVAQQKKKNKPEEVKVDTVAEQKKKLYVYACYMKPGKHYFMVRLDPPSSGDSFQATSAIKDGSPTKKTSEYDFESAKSFMTDSSNAKGREAAYYSHATIAPYRSEDIPVHVKTYGSLSTELVFKKNISVFKDWKENTGKILDSCCEHDFANWKIPNMPKFKGPDSAEELGYIKDMLRKNIEELEMIHLYYASESTFPFATSFNIYQFLNQFQITEAGMTKEFKGMVDTNMKAAFTSKAPGTIENSCLRFQFLEFIVRMAISKYMDSKKVQSPSDAVKWFLKKDILPNVAEIREKWSGFRQQRLWTFEVNEMFEANLSKITKLMQKYYSPRAKYLTMQDSVRIFHHHTDVLSEIEAKYIYGMSKMTNPNELQDLKKSKTITNIVELIEMIGRAADIKYRNQPEKGKPLPYKIALILDKILALIGAKHAAPKTKEIADESQSDEDY